MERRRRLADLLAVAAGELLADVLDHLPLPRDHLQRLGDVLAQLAQPRAAAAQAGGRAGLDHPLARQMLGEGLARRALAGEGHHIRRSWPRPARRRSRPRWPNSRVPRTPAPSGRAAAPCVPSAGRRAGASASRSAIADARSAAVSSEALALATASSASTALPPSMRLRARKQRRLQRVDVVRQVFTGGRHGRYRITNPGR